MRQRAFTLLELLLVIGIMGLFLGLSIPSFRVFDQRSSLQNAAQEMASTLRLAQSKTLASQDGARYGVSFTTGVVPHAYTLFQGTSFESRDPAKDEVVQLSGKVEISVLALGGKSEIVFEKITGRPSVSGTLTLARVADPTQTRVLSILASGTVQEGSQTLPGDDSRVVDSRHVHVVYQGRTINTATESLRLVFPDTTFSFAISDNMQGSQVFWEGDVVSQGKVQHVLIHTHILNDVSQGTLFSLHRDRRYNTTILRIELSGDASGNLISYDAAGITTKGTSIYAQTPELQ
jgi:prepilin-type N-terminal cleavage/methylation domain-containing protein